jgi:two-component system, chemotaxis family, chemotaxis protein CheY
MKVLLVDDTTLVRVVLRRWCQTLGLREEDILEAENGQTALARFDLSSPDAVITDWSMPVMDGLTLVQEIRKRNSSVPIVMVTSQAERQHVIAAIQAGANDYLVKPFSPVEIRKKLASLLSVPAPRLERNALEPDLGISLQFDLRKPASCQPSIPTFWLPITRILRGRRRGNQVPSLIAARRWNWRTATKHFSTK